MTKTQVWLQDKQIDNSFVGRSDYLKALETLLSSQQRVLFLHGPGGIGKTWLLYRFNKKYQNRNGLISLNIIDMYATACHTIEGWQKKLVDSFPEPRREFDEYLSRYNGYQNLIRDQQEFSDVVDTARKGIHQAFRKACEQISTNQKIIVFLDTLEVVQRQPIVQYIFKLMRELPNFKWVFASREKWNGNGFVYVMPVAGFSNDEAVKLVSKIGGTLTPTARRTIEVIREKLQGKPLMLELAIKWLDSSLLQNPDIIPGLSEKDLERAMLEPLRRLGASMFGDDSSSDAIYYTILYMAYCNHRFTEGLLRTLSDKKFIDLGGLNAADVLRQIIASCFFTKVRPDGIVQLHDEMERLIIENLWTEYDPEGTIRRELGGEVVTWYDEQISNNAENFALRGDLEAEQLFYQLRLNFNGNISRFATLFDQYYDNNDLSSCEELVIEIERPEFEPSIAKLKAESQIEIYKRLALIYYRLSAYDHALEYAEKFKDLANEINNPEQQFGSWMRLFNVQWRQNPERGIEHLKQALKIAEDQKWIDQIISIQYLLGFTCRAGTYQYGDAKEWCTKCLAHTPTNDFQRAKMAAALNDLGYIHAQTGHEFEATAYVRRGLAIRQQLLQKSQNLRDLYLAKKNLALSYNTFGEVNRYFGKLPPAVAFYEKAAELFEEVKDYENVAIARQALGDTQRRIGLAVRLREDPEASQEYFDSAKANLELAIVLYHQYGLDRDVPAVHRRYGRYWRDIGDNYQAVHEFNAALDAAKSNNDDLEALEALQELLFIAAHLADEENFGEWYSQYKAIIHSSHSHLPHVIKVFEPLGEIAQGLLIYKSKPDEALDLFISGYVGLAKEPGYGYALYKTHRDLFFKCIKDLREKEQKKNWFTRIIQALNDNELIETCRDLYEYSQVELMTLDLDSM